MTLSFETTHEYYLKDASMYYCEDHDSLMLTQDYEDRLVIAGLKPGTVLKFAQEIVKKSLEKEVEKTKDASIKKTASK